MARFKFDSLFTKLADGSLQPNQITRVGGVTLGPGVIFGRGAVFAGIDFTKFEKNDFEVELDGGVLVIKGIYGPIEEQQANEPEGSKGDNPNL